MKYDSVERLTSKKIKEKLSKKQINLILVLLYRFSTSYETFVTKPEGYDFEFGNETFKIAKFDYEYVCDIIKCIIK
jgi:hypothetical protein